MKPGPRPTPTPVLEVRGSWRAKKRAGEVKAESGVPPRPEWLLPAAAAEWDRVVPLLLGTGCLSALDLGVLAGYCQSFARWKAAEEWMTANGTVVVIRDDKGNVKSTTAAPQFSVAQRSLEKVLRFAEQLGLSAAARTRLRGEASAGVGGKAKAGKGRFFGGAAV